MEQSLCRSLGVENKQKVCCPSVSVWCAVDEGEIHPLHEKRASFSCSDVYKICRCQLALQKDRSYKTYWGAARKLEQILESAKPHVCHPVPFP